MLEPTHNAEALPPMLRDIAKDMGGVCIYDKDIDKLPTIMRLCGKEVDIDWRWDIVNGWIMLETNLWDEHEKLELVIHFPLELAISLSLAKRPSVIILRQTNAIIGGFSIGQLDDLREMIKLKQYGDAEAKNKFWRKG